MLIGTCLFVLPLKTILKTSSKPFSHLIPSLNSLNHQKPLSKPLKPLKTYLQISLNHLKTNSKGMQNHSKPTGPLHPPKETKKQKTEKKKKLPGGSCFRAPPLHWSPKPLRCDRVARPLRRYASAELRKTAGF